jgi:MFS family permease
MKINSNYTFSSLLWFSHFLTDSIAAFALTTISLSIHNSNNFILDTYFWISAVWYFLFYNFLAFFWQICIWYFLDKIVDNKKYLYCSKLIVISSFILYVIWWLLLQFSFIFAITFIGIWSCLFHIWGWSIALVSDKDKATHLWIFASGWVVWLSYGWFLVVFFAEAIFLTYVLLIIIWYFIYNNRSYSIEEKLKNDYSTLHTNLQKYVWLIVFLLACFLVLRSAIWTSFQIEFINNKIIIFYLAIAAFLWKITWWILQDAHFFKEKYFIWIWALSFLFIFLYSFHIHNLMLLLIWIFWIQIFVSPITLIMYKLMPENRSKIIWFTFWMSLVLWFLLLQV